MDHLKVTNIDIKYYCLIIIYVYKYNYIYTHTNNVYKKQLIDIINNRIIIIDGAMGTMIQKYNLDENDYRGNLYQDKHKKNSILLKGNNDLLSITRPEIIRENYKKYLEAGSDIIETNTFSGTTIAQADYMMENQVYSINYESAKIAKEVCIEETRYLYNIN